MPPTPVPAGGFGRSCSGWSAARATERCANGVTMRIGVTFPQTEIGNDPAAIRDYAQAVEDLGFSHVLAYDHVLGARPEQPEAWRGPYTYEHPFHEPFVLFGFLAGITRTLELATGVIVLNEKLRERAIKRRMRGAAGCTDGRSVLPDLRREIDQRCDHADRSQQLRNGSDGVPVHG